MKYYPTTERNEVLICAINFRNITLSLRNQILKTTYCIISFMGNVQNRQIIETK